ncbi:ATP/GTP-binding protein [Methylomonas sp. DH-1]|uniref:AAA family ATPase n=1 Tax=Methylomonas sp. (strain DH-1) TaxID=1727196 RepID=UPI0007C88312|nr:ATP-binding protein [Methylomonas sp. DH-1]ANE56181.1 hypothetical protein AYM39_13975 [Methylomonas sp. DH-1]
MLTNLRIRNFRMLEDLEIPKLGRVNLIVGKNNSGKSSILEALRLYTGKASPELMRRILISHDEYYDFNQNSNIENTNNWHGLKNLFTNREFPENENTFISIASEEGNLIKIEYVFYYIKEEPVIDNEGDIIDITSRRVIINQSELSTIEETSLPTPAIRITLKSGRNTLLDLNEDNRKRPLSVFWLLNAGDSLKCSFVSTTFSSTESLAKLWDQITIGPNEDIVLDALKIIDENIERLAFVESENRTGRLAIIKLKNSDTRIPLSSMGDGMSRILQLILSVFSAKDGLLLIDEFENGLHYSVQEEVWRIIFQLAKDLNIQVFATTHSWDCIESFTKAAVSSPEEGILLKVSKSKLTSDNGKIIATIYDEEALKTVTASALEVR